MAAVFEAFWDIAEASLTHQAEVKIMLRFSRWTSSGCRRWFATSMLQALKPYHETFLDDDLEGIIVNP